MLSEYRKYYEQTASLVPAWVHMSKSELCLNYIKYKEEKNSIAECYLAGLIAKYLKKAEAEYNSQYYKVISEDQYYNLITESILYVLDKQVWKDENSKLYNKESAPEIAINTNFKTSKINLFIYLQRDKRKLNNTALSLDTLEENSSDGYFIPAEDRDISTDMCIDSFVKKYFSNKEYINAYSLDLIINNDVFNNGIANKGALSITKVRNILTSLDYKYCKSFSDKYKVNFQEVKESIKYIEKTSNSSIDTLIRKLVKTLRRNKEFSDIVHNAC